MSISSKKIKLLGSSARQLRRADKLTAICEPNVYQCGMLNISQPYRPQRPVTGIALFPFYIIISKAKAIPVTGLGGLQGCEMLRIPHCLDNRLTDGGKFVSPTHSPHSTPQEHYFYVSGTHFC
jgi:hypothetical protein